MDSVDGSVLNGGVDSGFQAELVAYTKEQIAQSIQGGYGQTMSNRIVKDAVFKFAKAHHDPVEPDGSESLGEIWNEALRVETAKHILSCLSGAAKQQCIDLGA
jgi:hypothetical protein